MKRLLTLIVLLLSGIGLFAQTELLPYPTDTIQDTLVYRYTAPKSIGLYRISKTFGVPQDVIIRWNPQLKERGPQLDEVLLIPAGVVTHHPVQQPVVQSEVRPVVQPVVKPTAQPAVQPVVEPVMVDETPITAASDTDVLRIAVMLPLNARATERDADDDRFYDFYCGLLLAVYDAQAAGQRIEIHTFDLPRTDKDPSHILSNPWVGQAHAIIGPAYAQQVAQVAAWCKRQHKWLLVPFTSHVDGIADNPYVLQFNPSSEVEAALVAQGLKEHADSLHCVMVDAEGNTTVSMQLLRKKITEQNISLSTVTLHELMNDSADYAFRDDKENLLILHTDKYSNARILLPHIEPLAIRHKTTLLVQFAWLKEWLNLPVKCPYVCPTLFMRDNPDDSHYAALFARYFRQPVSSSMPYYDQLGYDLSLHLIRVLPALLAGEAHATVLERRYEGLQSVLQYRPAGEQGGWMNQYLNFVWSEERP